MIWTVIWFEFLDGKVIKRLLLIGHSFLGESYSNSMPIANVIKIYQGSRVAIKIEKLNTIAHLHSSPLLSQ